MFENIRLSFKGIWSHKIRSLLTMLGIIIGIAAIIAIVSTIKGTNERIKDNIIGAGNNTIKITLSQGDYPADFTWQSPPDNIRLIDNETIDKIKDLDEVTDCSVYISRAYNTNTFYKNTNLSDSCAVMGVDENCLETSGYKIKKGKSFSKRDFEKFHKFAIIDSVVEQGYFMGENPIGKYIDINGEPFEVIGVAVKNSDFEPVINSISDYKTYKGITLTGNIFIPINDWGIVYRYDEPQNCIIRAKNTDAMTEAGKKSADILNKLIPSDKSEDKESAYKYKSESLLEKAKSLQELSNSTNSMLIWIAGISLLVGGIGVMNIMLVSVTERTREIGLKKALGARKGKILCQFLTEAAVLTSMGGIIGVLSGIGLAKIISSAAHVPTSISTASVVISVVFSMLVGIIFGLLPSIKAAKLNPIDALRYE